MTDCICPDKYVSLRDCPKHGVEARPDFWLDATEEGSGTTHRANTEPVASKHTAFQARLGKILFDDWADEGEHLPESAHCPTCITEITEALRETIQACKPQEWDYTDTDAVAALDEYETALLEAITVDPN